MGFFFLAMLVLIVAAIGFFLVPLMGKSAQSKNDRQQQNILIAREQLQDLERQYHDGEIDRDAYSQLKKELELSLAQGLEEHTASAADTQISWQVVLAIVAFFPLAGGLFYFQLGSPRAILETESAGQQPAAEQEMPSIPEMVASLESKLKQNPDDLKGWLMLGRSYLVLNEFDKSVKVYARLYDRLKGNADFLVQYADAAAMAQNQTFAGRPLELLQEALAIDKQHPQGLWLIAMAEEETGDLQQALGRWQSLEPLFKDNDQAREEISKRIQSLQSRL